MAALQKLDLEIESALRKEEEQRSFLLLRKSQFAQAGPEVERIAGEYAAVQKQIEEVQWALKNLKTV